MSETNEKDELRLCPTCRMPISVLATRCRHCGEEVGRPRKEEHKLTLKDLGGDARTNYTISGNVMDALDAFRAEELNAQQNERRQREEAASSTWFRKKPADAGPPPAGGDSDLPELDAFSRELAGVDSARPAGSTRRSPSPARRNLGPTPQERLIQAGIGLAVLVALYFAGTFGWKKYQDYLAEQERLANPAYESKALAMLEQNLPLADVLAEAVEAVRQTDSPENRQALDTVRARVTEEIEKLLNAPVYARETLDQASMLATRAALTDTDPRFQELDKAVKAELDAYLLVLQSLDVKTQRAKFKIHDPAAPAPEQEVGVGDYVGGRFVVQSILDNQVRLVDSKRLSPTGQRAIIARPLAPVTGS